MPVMKCSKSGQSGHKWGEAGVCFVGSDSEEKAKQVGRAIQAGRNDGKYGDIDFTPPKGVREAYKRGIELHEQGKSGSGLESSTVAMARKLAGGKAVSPEWARKANRFWARNERFLDDSEGADYTSAMLWGGRAGKSWYSKLYKQMEAADKE